MLYPYLSVANRSVDLKQRVRRSGITKKSKSYETMLGSGEFYCFENVQANRCVSFRRCSRVWLAHVPTTHGTDPGLDA